MEYETTCVSTRACSMSVLASAVRPLMATPMWVSTSAIFSMLEGSCAPGILLSQGICDLSRKQAADSQMMSRSCSGEQVEIESYDENPSKSQ